MLVHGFLLSVLTTAGFITIYKRLPEKIRVWMVEHEVTTAISAKIGALLLFGTHALGLFAGAFTGLLVWGLLAAAKDPEAQKGLEIIGEKISSGLSWLKATILGGLQSIAG